MANSTAPTLRFRVATPDDAPLLHPLVESAYRGDESRLGWTTEADLLTGDRIDADGLLAKITHPNGAVLLAFSTDESNPPTKDDKEHKETLIACCEVARRSPQTAYFGMFAVSPRRQGGGIGRQVLGHAEDYCRRTWGVATLEMTVIATRTELVEWYVRRGYRPTGETQPFPFEELARLNSIALRTDLSFVVLGKDLRGDAGGGSSTATAEIARGDSTPVVGSGEGGAAGLVVPTAGVRVTTVQEDDR